MDYVSAPRVSIHALGCKLNHSELEDYGRRLEAYGFLLVGPREEADAYILNTCTVTSEADRKVRQWLRSTRKRNPDALIVAAGCSVERESDRLDSLADMMVGNKNKERLPDIVAGYLRERHVGPAARGTRVWKPRSRATVKIQEGCSQPCTYCVIPLVRGSERSVPVQHVIGEVADRVREGHAEIVLTGTRVGAYSYEGTRLSDLVRRLLAIDGLRRLRLSSLQPYELSPALLESWNDARVCPHVHMSLQSGSAGVLGRMRRGYSPTVFLAAMDRLRKSSPRMAMTTDVIVGFPGETETEFRETVAFCEEAGFSRIHVFPFSPRPGTPAAEMDGALSPKVLRERAALMNRVAVRSRVRHDESCLGSRRDVLWEGETGPGSGVWAGTTEDYIRVLVDTPAPLNHIECVLLDRLEGDKVWARRLCEDSS
ncbi:MAG: tRNA (N(6)-L-threonylcarbamoyladenosine(37)-C(2))-methylthiotransferase MtaB [Chloroflexota bacterium]